MSAPRPYVTDPFHPLSSICNNLSFLYIYQSVPVISSKWYVKVSWNRRYLTIAHVLFKYSNPKVDKKYSGYFDFHSVRAGVY